MSKNRPHVKSPKDLTEFTDDKQKTTPDSPKPSAQKVSQPGSDTSKQSPDSTKKAGIGTSASGAFKPVTKKEEVTSNEEHETKARSDIFKNK